MSVPPDLLVWLRKHVEAGGESASATCFKLVSKYVPDSQANASSKEVGSWQRPFPSIEALAEEIGKAIDADMVSMDDPIAIYLVLPYFSESEKPRGRFAIRRENPDFSDGAIEPHPGGIKLGGIGPRHLETMWKLTTGPVAETVRLLSEQNVALTKDVRTAQETILKGLKVQQELLDKNAELLDKNAELLDKNVELLDKNAELLDKNVELQAAIVELRGTVASLRETFRLRDEGGPVQK